MSIVRRVWFAIVTWCLAAGLSVAGEPTKAWIFIGTYSGPNSKGIYRSTIDLTTGELSPPEVAAELTNPSFLAIHPNGKSLYAVGEISEFRKKKVGAVSAFALDPATGALKLLNQTSTGGPGPCHVVVDRTGKNVLMANYGGGSASSVRIVDNGSLGDQTWFSQHVGTSVNPKRQEGPHAHSINVDPGNRFAVVADLGMDKVMIYTFDAATGKLSAATPSSVEVTPGAGPRHFAFHPSMPYGYVINELNSTVTAFKFNPKTGSLNSIQVVSTLPVGFTGDNYPAEVVAHPNGKFLYGSNRGHDSIVAYSIDHQNGTLSYVAHQNKGIKTPRNFAIDPTGKFLLVGSQGTGAVLVFEIDSSSGELKPTKHQISVGAPVCIRFLNQPSK